MSRELSDNEKVNHVVYKLGEPSFRKRNNVIMNMDEEYYGDYEEDTVIRYADDETSRTFTVKSYPKPDLSFCNVMPLHIKFSPFHPVHTKCAEKLLHIFMDCKSVDEFLSTSIYAKERINKYLFSYCYCVALSHRKDTENMEQPNPLQIMPSNYLNKDVLQKSRKEVLGVPAEHRKIIEIPFDFTASCKDPEHALIYFREDIGVNLHHWHWHLIYPPFGPPDIIEKDRRGELFLHMHHFILNRYNLERLCNHLPEVEMFPDFMKPIRCGYFPKMNNKFASRNIPPRQANTYINDLIFDPNQPPVRVSLLKEWEKRINDCISNGFAIRSDGSQVNIRNDRGVDVLGDLIEASAKSVNLDLYGSLHNMGHVFIAKCHDPLSHGNELFGVMTDTSTAMRDPIFYSWHTYIDSFLTRFKMTLNPYTPQELGYPGIIVQNMQLVCDGKYTKELKTHWEKDIVSLKGGLDFTSTTPVDICFTHLNHKPFTYKITVNNTTGEMKRATCRIFLAPKYNSAREELSIGGYRRYSFEMDRFIVNLKTGTNVVIRKSSESSLVIPFDRIFHGNKDKAADSTTAPEQPAPAPATGPVMPSEGQRWCSCGWPAYLILPKGTISGIGVTFFVMFSDYEIDKVDDKNTTTDGCQEAVLFCGIRSEKYPDSRAMGYPFDRPIFVDRNEFMLPNMFMTDCTIKHVPTIKISPNIPGHKVVEDYKYDKNKQ